MSSIQKIAISLLVTILLSAVFFATALSDVSKMVETRFYQPAVIASYLKKTDEAAKSLETYLNDEKKRFAEYALNSFIESFLQATPSDVDVQMRTKITGDTFMSTTGLLGLRFIDANGRYVHYSTFSTDILSRTENRIEYKNYGDLGELPFSAILPEDMGDAPQYPEELAKRIRVIFDNETDASGRIIFSVPYYDMLSVFRGFLAFYVSAQDFPHYLISLGQSTLGTQSTLVVSRDSFGDAGFLFDVPPLSSDANKALRLLLVKAAGEKWHSEKDRVITLNEADENDIWTLFTAHTSSGEKIGWLVKSDVFLLNGTLRLFFLASAAIVLFLIIFLLCCLLFRDKMQIVRKRIRRFQFHIITDYLEKKEKVDWQTIADSIQLSKSDFSAQIKESLGHVGKRKSREIDALLEKSWSDILTVLGAKDARGANSFSLEQLKRMLEEVLKNHQPSVQVVAASESPKRAGAESEIPAAEAVDDIEEIEEAEDAEEIEEIGEAEEIEEIEEAEEVLDAEDVQGLEEIGEADELPEHLKPKPAEDFKNNPLSDDIAKLLQSNDADVSEPLPLDEAEIADAEPVADEENAQDVEEIADAEPEILDTETAENPAEEIAQEVEAIPEDAPAAESEEALNEEDAAEPELEPIEEIAEKNMAEPTAQEPKNTAETKKSENQNGANTAENDDEEDEIVTSEFEDEFDEVTAAARAEDKIEEEKSARQIFNSDDFVYQKPDFSFLDDSAFEAEDEIESDDFPPEAELLPIDSSSESYVVPLFCDVQDCTEELFGEDETASVVERNGVFVVAPNLDVAQSEKNQGLVELVDSVSHSRGIK